MAPTFVHLDRVQRSLKSPFQIAAQVGGGGGWASVCGWVGLSHGWRLVSPEDLSRPWVKVLALSQPHGAPSPAVGPSRAGRRPEHPAVHGIPHQRVRECLSSLWREVLPLPPLSCPADTAPHAGVPAALPPPGQDCWVSKGGAYTGEVSAEMLHDMGIPWVILGHSGEGLVEVGAPHWRRTSIGGFLLWSTRHLFAWCFAPAHGKPLRAPVLASWDRFLTFHPSPPCPSLIVRLFCDWVC